MKGTFWFLVWRLGRWLADHAARRASPHTLGMAGPIETYTVSAGANLIVHEHMN